MNHVSTVVFNDVSPFVSIKKFQCKKNILTIFNILNNNSSLTSPFVTGLVAHGCNSLEPKKVNTIIPMM